MNFPSMRNMDLTGKTVLLRGDLNVPVRDGNLTDASRITRLKPTIDHLVKTGAKTLILSHFGRPAGKKDPAFSLEFLTPVLEEEWKTTVAFIDDCIGPAVENAVSSMENGDIALLENVRFHAGEKQNDPEFAKELAKLADIYINDAFSASHRAHASTEAIAHLLPTGAGMLMEEELKALDQALENPQRPVAAIIGGSKISTKLSVLHNFVEKVDYLVLGGAMANTFLYADGMNIGKSMCEKDMAGEAKNILKKAENSGCRILLPQDVIAVEEIKPQGDFKMLPVQDMQDNMIAIDIGDESLRFIEEKIRDCNTILWNGPMGVFEVKPFDTGTNKLAQFVAKQTRNGFYISVAGGGDTVAALQNAGVLQDFTYISTAGGAFLEWMEGKTLPGVAALNAYNKAA